MTRKATIAAAGVLLAGTLAFGQATLPTFYSGPWKAGPLPSGWTAYGLRSPDYADNYDGVDGNAAGLDSAGDWVKINFSDVPATVSYWLKGNSLSGEYTFKVQESVDGSTWTDVAIFNSSNSIPNSPAAAHTNNLLSTSRYVQFIYVVKASGNVGLDGVTINGAGVSFIPSGPQNAPVGYPFNLTVSIAPTTCTMKSWTFLPSNYAGTVSMSSNIFQFTPAAQDEGSNYTLKVISTNPVTTGTVSVTVTPFVLPDPYVCTFEDGNKISYVTANVSLSNRVWELAGILIGTDTNSDLIIGSKAARLQYGYYDGNEAMTIQSPLMMNGIGTISLWYGPFSTHGTNAPTLAIEISESLDSGWVEVGAVNAGLVTNLTYYSADVYVNSPLYVRIRAKSGTSSKSANFDNITIAPYTAPSNSAYDAYLLQYNVTPGDPGTATNENLDGDAFTNQDEYLGGTNPYDDASHP